MMSLYRSGFSSLLNKNKTMKNHTHKWIPLKGKIEGRRCKECLQDQYKVKGEWHDEEDEIFNKKNND